MLSDEILHQLSNHTSSEQKDPILQSILEQLIEVKSNQKDQTQEIRELKSEIKELKSLLSDSSLKKRSQNKRKNGNDRALATD